MSNACSLGGPAIKPRQWGHTMTHARAHGDLNPTRARAVLKRKTGTLVGMYYAVGVQVPPRRGASFSMRYEHVASAREGVRELRARLSRKRVGMAGHLIAAVEGHDAYVELAAAVREKGGNGGSNAGTVSIVYPNTTVGWVRRLYAKRLPR